MCIFYGLNFKITLSLFLHETLLTSPREAIMSQNTQLPRPVLVFIIRPRILTSKFQKWKDTWCLSGHFVTLKDCEEVNMSAMTVRTVQGKGFKKARVYYFCASVCHSRETFFSEFELESSPYKFSSCDNKLVRCEKFSILNKLLKNVKFLVCCRNYFLCLFCLLKRNV